MALARYTGALIMTSQLGQHLSNTAVIRNDPWLDNSQAPMHYTGTSSYEHDISAQCKLTESGSSFYKAMEDTYLSETFENNKEVTARRNRVVRDTSGKKHNTADAADISITEHDGQSQLAGNVEYLPLSTNLLGGTNNTFTLNDLLETSIEKSLETFNNMLEPKAKAIDAYMDLYLKPELEKSLPKEQIKALRRKLYVFLFNDPHLVEVVNLELKYPETGTLFFVPSHYNYIRNNIKSIFKGRAVPDLNNLMNIYARLMDIKCNLVLFEKHYKKEVVLSDPQVQLKLMQTILSDELII